MALNKDVADVMAEIKKAYGDHAISLASDVVQFDAINSGSLCLDYIIGPAGGLPSNRVVEFAGEPGSGKSTLALHAMNNALEMYPDRLAVYFDFEQKITKPWMANFIKDMDRVMVVSPDHIEQATDQYGKLVKTGKICVVTADSIGGAPTIRTVNKSSEIASFGGNAMGVSDFARTVATLGGKYGCLTIGINQIRQDMSGYRRLMTPGGEAWKHACSLRVQLKRGPDKYIEKQPNGEEIQVGYDVIVKIVKSGIGTPFRATKYRFYSQRSQSGAFGVDRLDEIMRLAKLAEVIERRGGWYYHALLPGGKIQGEAGLLDYAREDVVFADSIEHQIREKISKGDNIVGASTTFDEEDAEQDDNEHLAYKLRKAEERASDL